MIVRIAVKDRLGSVPATARQTEALLESFNAAKVDWILDFAGVTSLTDDFVDGFFVKIAELNGPKVFERQLTWINLVHAERIRLHHRLIEVLSSGTSHSSQ